MRWCKYWRIKTMLNTKGDAVEWGTAFYLISEPRTAKRCLIKSLAHLRKPWSCWQATAVSLISADIKESSASKVCDLLSRLGKEMAENQLVLMLSLHLVIMSYDLPRAYIPEASSFNTFKLFFGLLSRTGLSQPVIIAK